MSQSFIRRRMKTFFGSSWIVMLMLHCRDDIMCRAYGDFDDESDVLGENPPISPRIVNGGVSTPEASTFFVRSGFDEFYWTPELLCGGTLIHSDIFITAAHCSGGFNYGAIIYDPATNDFTRQVEVDRQLRHPLWNFDNSLLNFDILALRLTTPIASTDPVKPIAYNTDPNFPSVAGQLVKGYGFGRTEDGSISQELREADFQYITREDCASRTVLFSNVVMGEDILCTEGTTTSTCSGDSGGPLTDIARTMIIGVISFGVGCSPDNIPDGSVRTSAVAGWIKDSICLMSNNKPSDCPTVTPQDPAAVKLSLYFLHDFYAEETTFAIRAKASREIVYTGPTYIPARNDPWKSDITLLPGEYVFEVYDSMGNGLQSDGLGDGSWELMALYDGVTETRLAGGDGAFGREQLTNFVVTNNNVVNNDQMDSCLISKEREEALGASIGTLCECVQTNNDVTLTCRNGTNGAICAANHAPCVSASDCCNNSRCTGGLCRTRTSGPERGRLGSGFGGAAGRQRLSGNSRRLLLGGDNDPADGTIVQGYDWKSST